MRGKHTEATKQKLRLLANGRRHTEATKKKIGLISLSRWQNPEFREKQKARKKGGGWNRGLTQETDIRMKLHAQKMKGRTISEKTRAKIAETNHQNHLLVIKERRRLGGLRAWEKRRQAGTDKVQGHPAWNKGLKGWLKHTPEARQKISEKVRAWLNSPEGKNHPAYARGCKSYPNKPETHLSSLLNTYFPNEWKYVGDGKIVIEGRNPDFININGKKQVIELLGTYWHPLFDGANRIEHYRQYGFQCLIIWEDELKHPNKVVAKVKKFIKYEAKL